MTLNDIPFKQQCHVVDIKIKDKIKRQRLLDFGLGYFNIEKENVAPLGDPIMLKINNSFIAIRAEDASQIIVKAI